MAVNQQALDILQSYGWSSSSIQKISQALSSIPDGDQVHIVDQLGTSITPSSAESMSAGDLSIAVQTQGQNVQNARAASSGPPQSTSGPISGIPPTSGMPLDQSIQVPASESATSALGLTDPSGTPLGKNVADSVTQAVDPGTGTSSGPDIPSWGASEQTLPSGASVFPQNWQNPDFGAQDIGDFQALTGDNIQTAYAQYVKNFQLAHAGGSHGQMLQGSGIDPMQRGTPVPMGQWLHQTMTAAYGLAFEVGHDMSILYEQTYGEPMPDELRRSIVGKIANNPDASVTAANLRKTLQEAVAANESYNKQNNLNNLATKGASEGNYQSLANMLTTGGLLDKEAPWLGKMVGDYVTAHPAKDKVAAKVKENLYYAFLYKLNRAPTEAEYASLAGKSVPEVDTYIDNTKMSNGMTYASYTSTKSRLGSKWSQYFGQAPDDNTLKTMAGKSDADINNYISSQPSKNAPSLTIGQYESYGKTVDNIANKYYGYTSNDFLQGMLKAEGKA